MTSEQARTVEGSGHGAGKVLALLFGLATLLGVIAYWRFTRSDRYLQRTLKAIVQRGPSLSPEQCVDEVLVWSRRCQAMKSLCDASVPRMMEGCLWGADRRPFCGRLGDRVMATQFGFAECRARGRDRRDKTCALAYRTLADHCVRLSRSVAHRTPSSEDRS
jgi:hypothetical protein